MKKVHKHKYKLIIGIISLMVLILGFFNFPLPKLVEGPGEAVNLKTMVSIKGHPDNNRGKLLLTSVGISQATPYSYVQSLFYPYYNLENINDVTQGENEATYNNVQKFYMQSAINSAIYVGSRAAHAKVKLHNEGIYVLSKLKQSTFNKLHVGDIILKVNGKKYANASGYQKYIKHHRIGSKIRIQYLRGKHYYNETGKLIKLPETNNSGIGITLTDNLKVKSKLPTTINPGAIGGPSAGLMFSLQVYSQLANHNLKRGRIIAGTGTISPSGQVGEIGGIDKKVITAKKQGATIFLAPYIKPSKAILSIEPDHVTNYQLAKQTAKKYAPNMKVIPIKTFNDALKYLNK